MAVRLDSLVWLLLLLGPLLILQRLLQREIQAIFLLLTRRPDIAVMLFSILFFPGVLLHETSHFVMARLLGVRTGRFSLLPRALPNGRLQLGYVETGQADWLRDALIGAAPLLVGGSFVAYAGINQMSLLILWKQLVALGPPGALNIFQSLYKQPDFWLWFYLVFAVSSTMVPSASDRRAWLPISLLIAGLLGFSLLAGAGPWLIVHFSNPLDRALQVVAVVFGISDFIHLFLLPPLWGLRKLLSRLTGMEVVR